VLKLKPAHRLAIIAACCLAISANAAEDSLSRDDLFGDDLPLASAPTHDSGPGIKGFVQFEAARTTGDPEHWSKLRARSELGSAGKLGEGLKWKLGARFDYDFVYGIDDYYPDDVKRNQRYNVELRENYLDYSNGDWDFRFGKQHVVWGEMVGLFFADVVSARDLREFVLPDFDQMRIPQWAARAEYFANDFHAELLWIPVASYDNIGKPGSEFYPMPKAANIRYLPEQRPERNADNMNYGLRLSTLKNGWDISGFYYRSSDVTPTFYRQFDGPTTVYQARHDRINQYGGTLSKDFGEVVLKAEGVYTTGRSFGVMDLTDSDGVVRQNTIDWAVGLDFTLPAESRFNVQLYQRRYSNYNPTQIPDKEENGYSLLFNTKFINNWEGQAIFISSLNRTDWLLRPRLTWNFQRNWRMIFGADIFKGPPTGLFGQFDQKDRIYSELRYSF
jgi:hypothetical protein